MGVQLPVANGSFEQPAILAIDPIPNPPVVIDTPGWVNANPGDIGIFYNFPGTPGTITNADGDQVAYMLVSGTSLSQQLSGQVFEAGMHYDLSAGVAVSLQYPPPATDSLLMSLFYLDEQSNPQVLASLPIYNDAATGLSPTALKYLSLGVDVAPNDPAVGRTIGIAFTGNGALTSFGYFDLDNVTLTAVPEPTTLSLLGLALCGLAMRSRRVRR